MQWHAEYDPQRIRSTRQLFEAFGEAMWRSKGLRLRRAGERDAVGMLSPDHPRRVVAALRSGQSHPWFYLLLQLSNNRLETSTRSEFGSVSRREKRLSLLYPFTASCRSLGRLS